MKAGNAYDRHAASAVAQYCPGVGTIVDEFPLAFLFDSISCEFACAFAFDSNAFYRNQMRIKCESNANQMRIKCESNADRIRLGPTAVT